MYMKTLVISNSVLSGCVLINCSSKSGQKPY
jgi:hypothetical protein